MKKRIFLIMIALVVFSGASSASAETDTLQFVLEEESRFWLEGSSTVHDYRCEATGISGRFTISTPISWNDELSSETAVLGGEIVVPVLNLKSKKKKLNRKMYKAMSVNKFPEIVFTLTKAIGINDAENDSLIHNFNVVGNLSISGVTNEIDMTVAASMIEGGKMRVAGEKTLFMKDFGIKPPTMFLGTLKTHNKIIIKFDLVFKPDKHISS